MIFYALRWKVLRPTCCISIAYRFCGGYTSILVYNFFYVFGTGQDRVALEGWGQWLCQVLPRDQSCCQCRHVAHFLCHAKVDMIPQCSCSGCSW